MKNNLNRNKINKFRQSLVDKFNEEQKQNFAFLKEEKNESKN